MSYIGAESRSVSGTAIELVERFSLESAIAPLTELDIRTDCWRSYVRASAIARLDSAAGAKCLEEYYKTLPLSRLLTPSPGCQAALGDSVLRRAECLPVIARLVAALTEDSRLAKFQVPRITLALSRLTGNYEGFATSLSLDEAAVSRVGARWADWLKEYGDRLTWDASLNRFTW